jgi:hypothetical protein
MNLYSCRPSGEYVERRSVMTSLRGLHPNLPNKDPKASLNIPFPQDLDFRISEF